MAKAKRKTLPKDFEELLNAGELEVIKAVLEKCQADARGGVSKQTALAFYKLPDEVARWLVANGADISATDIYGATPLHARAWRGKIGILLELGADVNGVDKGGDTPLHKAAAGGNLQNARILLEHGARVDAPNNRQLSPLAFALHQCSNADIRTMADMAELLLTAQADSGATGDALVSPAMREAVTRIGTNFEFHRGGFNPEYLDATSAALDKLYRLFGVPPVPRRDMHDGKSPIVAKAASWEEHHQELWKFLVPSSGAAATVQGEVIRLSGRIAIEIDENGGVNWDEDFKQMADALLTHLGSGTSLSSSKFTEAANIVSKAKRKHGDMRRLCELAVDWVALNPQPVVLPKPSYRH